jgi:hypothetical protein
MHTIFVGGIATGRFAMGSNEPLGTASPAREYMTDSQDSDTIIIDGSDKPFLAPPEVNILVLGRTYDPLLETVMHALVSYDLAVTICYLFLYLPLMFLC